MAQFSLWLGMVWHGIEYSIVRYDDIVQYSMVWYGTVWHQRATTTVATAIIVPWRGGTTNARNTRNYVTPTGATTE